jgi:hypothetical protein
MDGKGQEQIALHRWAVIAGAAGQKLTPAERGALVRQIAARAHMHPDGSSRTYSRGTVDRWLPPGAPACCAPRSSGTASPPCYIPTTEDASPTPRWPAPARCWASSWCTAGPASRPAGGRSSGAFRPGRARFVPDRR